MNPFELKREGNSLSVLLAGDLTAVLALTLKPELQQALQEGVTEINFDLGKTTVIDSVGIGLLVATHNSLKKIDGRLHVTQVSEDIFHLLQSMRLDQRLGVVSR